MTAQGTKVEGMSWHPRTGACLSLARHGGEGSEPGLSLVLDLQPPASPALPEGTPRYLTTPRPQPLSVWTMAWVCGEGGMHWEKEGCM